MMDKKIVFASNNAHKLVEIRNLLSDKFEILSLNDIRYDEEIIESGHTFHENALIKTKTIVEYSALSCFSDDSGLEVDILNGQPGVYSARFSGENAKDSENIDLLLRKLKGQSKREAQFKTVICLYYKEQYHYFEGIVRGIITEEIKGSHGFGYDPVFIPDGYHQTFAELGPEIKNKISHRAMAIQKLVKYLYENE